MFKDNVHRFGDVRRVNGHVGIEIHCVRQETSKRPGIFAGRAMSLSQMLFRESPVLTTEIPL